MSTRREARERAMQALYAFTVGMDSAEHVLETIIDEQMSDPEGRAFAKRLFLRVLDMKEEAEGLVSEYTQNWELSRIALIDRLVLRIAIAELLHFPDIPPKVTINEAIEVVKKYSTERSGQFVNGVLDAILDDFRKKGTLKKKGRGLIDTDVKAKN